MMLVKQALATRLFQYGDESGFSDEELLLLVEEFAADMKTALRLGETKGRS
jgi:hypothetical protein